MTQPADAGAAALVQCLDYNPRRLGPAVERAFSLLDAAALIRRGERVLIKPNFLMPKPAETAATTHPAVILETVRVLKDLGAKPCVGDSPAWGTLNACIAALNLREPLIRMGVPVVALNKPRRFDLDGESVGISTVALEMDKIINLPKLKAHKQLGASFAVKNMFGCTPGKEKAYWHFARGKDDLAFARLIVEIFRKLSPVLNLIDAVVAMQGPGPLNGTPYPLGLLVAGQDPIACEYLCCEVTGIRPESLPILRAADALNFGPKSLSEVRVLGDDVEACRREDFLIPERTPIHFSLPRIVKSVTKQILINTRAALTRRPK